MSAIIATLEWTYPVEKEIIEDEWWELEDWDVYDTKGVYVLLRRYRGRLAISYIGISHNSIIKRISQHDYPISKFDFVKVPLVSIRGGTITQKRLELIEHVLIHVMQPTLNIRGKSYPPDRDIIIYNKGQKSPFPKRIEVYDGELIEPFDYF